ncbi:hypothetical protein CVV38_01475 [Candidatus Peregrinibacteria bacterium HGW-Peregrinibacteria-1]|jgi:competence protein ComEC|nr:MAG: hypothetical protein CVV38_01475 [Candidatus Peregrinibacteria bacterium HGW-Peregrinibacteria-1]
MPPPEAFFYNKVIKILSGLPIILYNLAILPPMRIIITLAIILVALLSQLPDNRLHVYFLDIGQGDSIFIKTPNNHHILIDGGPDSTVVREISELMPFLNKNIDLIILTHPDADHLNGLIDVIERYSVSNIYLTGVANAKPEYARLFDLAITKNINLILADSQTDFKFGPLILDTLYPFSNISGNPEIAANDSSIVTKIIYRQHKILLTGDLEENGEKQLLNSHIDLTASIYKAGHHGSKTSSSLPFVKEISPEIAIIQAGKDNRYGHPHSITIQNLYKTHTKHIYNTATDGRIKIIFD